MNKDIKMFIVAVLIASILIIEGEVAIVKSFEKLGSDALLPIAGVLLTVYGIYLLATAIKGNKGLN